jgi:dsDNA-specific endonuclease/ATPase MutS2
VVGVGLGGVGGGFWVVVAGHPHIQSFQAAPPNQGGAGATIAALKK